jgi:hypothetical protein
MFYVCAGERNQWRELNAHNRRDGSCTDHDRRQIIKDPEADKSVAENQEII